MTALISFRCHSCNARIKAPDQLAGRSRPCPGCGAALVVPRRIPADAGAVLVAVDGGGDFMRVRPRY